MGAPRGPRVAPQEAPRSASPSPTTHAAGPLTGELHPGRQRGCLALPSAMKPGTSATRLDAYRSARSVGEFFGLHPGPTTTALKDLALDLFKGLCSTPGFVAPRLLKSAWLDSAGVAHAAIAAPPADSRSPRGGPQAPMGRSDAAAPAPGVGMEASPPAAAGEPRESGRRRPGSGYLPWVASHLEEHSAFFSSKFCPLSRGLLNY